ncbi:putative FK506-binding protein 2 [Blattamonas nauphoetae]|uniref:peptidylprolyl isomerase n=1 Tax=Blattamonas nauphoetae TaxID=2049346 RepID=A0ABQ9Y0A1_9EUKA|nr:putative FK506-binding protein 2 [Blattamonas nauphoetae]
MLRLAILSICVVVAQETTNSTKPGRKPPATLQIGVVSKPEQCHATVGVYDEVEIKFKLSLFSTDKILDETSPDESWIFRLGYNETLEGLEQGMLGMCVGEKRRLIIPPSVGYGTRGGEKSIPGFVSIRADVELINLEKRAFSHYYPRHLEKVKEKEQRDKEMEERRKKDDKRRKKEGKDKGPSEEDPIEDDIKRKEDERREKEAEQRRKQQALNPRPPTPPFRFMENEEREMAKEWKNEDSSEEKKRPLFYSEEDTKNRILDEETKQKLHENELKKKERRLTKYRELSSFILRRKRIFEHYKSLNNKADSEQESMKFFEQHRIPQVLEKKQASQKATPKTKASKKGGKNMVIGGDGGLDLDAIGEKQADGSTLVNYQFGGDGEKVEL